MMKKFLHSNEYDCRFARMIQVRHRSHATYSRQPRQVRKEATVTGSCVCSGSPVSGLFLLQQFSAVSVLRTKRFTRPLQLFAQDLRHASVSMSW